MISREAYTKIFLTSLERSCDAANVQLHQHRWWKSNRTKKGGGLRLSDDGFEFLVGELELNCYEVPFSARIELSPQTIIFFDQFLDCPYYLTEKSLTVFSEKKSFELYLFSDDIQKYGLIKAMNARNSDSQTK